MRSIREVIHEGTGRGVALIDSMQNETFYLYGLLKTGVIFADLEGLTPVAYPFERATRKQRLIVNSLCRCVVPSRRRFLSTILSHSWIVIKRTLKLSNLRDVLAIEIDGCKIGPYVYDASYVPRAERVTLWQRIKVAYLLMCHYMDRAVIDAYPVQLVLVGDPAGRTGMLFELCRARGIRTISAINVDVLQMQKYFTREQYKLHYRDVPESALALVYGNPLLDRKIDEYFTVRFSGAIQQHDVVRAFADHKVVCTKTELCEDYGLRPDLPLVFVMAHVFTDAPHAYPPMLYRDYEDWVIRTVLALAKNHSVNFLIKEHPSAQLYGESGILGQMLEKVGWQGRLLRSDLHTMSVLSAADAIVTCGGTIGIEASCCGIPVVLAARPPYAGKGFTHEPISITEYEDLLAFHIGQLHRLTREQVCRAKQVAYVTFELFDNDGQTLEFGRVPFMRGQTFNIEQYYRNVIEDSKIPLYEQRLYKILKRFHGSDDLSIINYDKLRSVLLSAG